MPSGGYRKPLNPAPASGPGRLSRRTDGGVSQKLMVGDGGAYGDRQALMSQERTAPLAQADSVAPAPIPTSPPPQAAPAAAGGGGGGAPYNGVPFGAPSQRPNEPITHGVDIGPGGGPEVLPPAAQPQYQSMGPMSQMLANLSARDQTGVIAQLYQSAKAIGA